MELDAKKPLIKEFLVDTYNSVEGVISGSTTVKVVYQWKPAHCSNCEVFGHSSDCCPSTDLAPSQAAKSTPSPAEQAKEVEWRKCSGGAEEEVEGRHLQLDPRPPEFR